MNNNIKQQRQAWDWTQQQLAASLGVSRQTIISIESEKYDPSLALAFKISKLFGQKIEDIFQAGGD